MTEIHKFEVEGISGEVIDFAKFKGKKIMVVNVASECGYTSQYQQLQELYEAFQDKLVIVGFPCNDFGGQEPADNKGIQNFCTTNYQVSFPMAAKISIKGSAAHPLYQWLTSKALNGKADSSVDWNFTKYLLDEQGHLYTTYPPSTSPVSEEIIDWISS